MRRNHLLGSLVAILTVLALTLIPSAGAAEFPPTMDFCHWWPNETAVHWDRAYLLSVYRSNAVVRVEFHWFNAFGPTDFVRIDGDMARATTPIGSTEADAQIFLANGRVVDSNTVNCVPKP